MDIDGYIKLADFGLSKKLISDSTCKTMAGTCYYLSPEIVKG